MNLKTKMKQSIPIFVLLATTVSVHYYWKIVCIGGGCSYALMDRVLDPIFYASLSLLTFFTFFLFLPYRYFRQWLFWVFSWGIVVAFLGVQANLDRPGSGPFPIFAREIIILQTVFFWIVTLVFCAVLWWRERRSPQNTLSNEKR